MPLGQNNVLPDVGETIENSRGTVRREFNVDSYENFSRELKEHRAHGNQILESVSKYLGKTQFEDIAQNVLERKSRLDKAIANLDKQVKTLESKINGNTQRTFESELEKQDLENLRAFRHLVEKELEREDVYRRKAMEKFLSLCVHHDLDAGDSA